MVPTHLLVATDLDGTLLNHDTYSYKPAMPLMHQLNGAGVPIILATSKTRAEVQCWQEKLSLEHPFIFENGSAVAFPDGSTTVLGTELQHLEDCLEPFMKHVTSLVHCSLEDAEHLSGLGRTQVEQARARAFSLPFMVNDPAITEPLLQRADAAGLQVLKGGRFFHLQGRCDKQLALARLLQHFDNACGFTHRVLALGDDQNDKAMLEHADFAVVVRKGQDYGLKLSNRRTYYTQTQAPQGWVEGITHALTHFKSE